MHLLWSPVSTILIGGLLPFQVNVLEGGRWPVVGLGAILLGTYWFRWSGHRSKTTLPQLAREVLIVVAAYLAYFLVRGFVEGREAEAFRRAVDIIELEQALGIFWEPDLQAYILRFDLLVNVLNWTYIWGHWPVIVFAALWLLLLHREAYPVYRNAFIISGAIGLIVFSTMPVAPPRFMDAWGFVDTVTDRSEAYRVLQPPAFVNQYAAMPSLHFGWNLLVGIAIMRHGAGLFAKIFGAVFPVFMFASIVLTANHFIIDGIAGGALALVGLFAAVALHNFMQRRTSAPRAFVTATPHRNNRKSVRRRLLDEFAHLRARRHLPGR